MPSLFVLAVGIGLFAILAYDYRLQQPRGGAARDYAELMTVEVMGRYRDVLPEQGESFRYCARPYPAYVNVSFALSERAFRDWALTHGLAMREVNPDAERVAESFIFEDLEGAPEVITVRDGLIYSENVYDGANLGSSILVAYARSTGRGYYSYVAMD